MGQNALLSIIIPCFNVADTLLRALDSIWMQRADFSYEVLIVDDCSTDDTVRIAQACAKEHEQIKLIRHQENRGNAWSYYDGLCAAQGDYFCVLDGDDYYTNREKIQRQVDFFKGDILEEYVATVHYYNYDLCDGHVSLYRRSTFSEFNYADFLTQRSGYYHTSTYMYRNIFKGHVPEYFKDIDFRGDMPRTAFHLQASHKKVKILDFVGSAYVFTQKGIWSGMTESKQQAYLIRMLGNMKRMTATPFEMNNYDKRIEYTKQLQISGNEQSIYIPASINYCLKRLKEYTSDYAFEHMDFMLESLYYSQYVDSLCATLGYVNRLYHPDCAQREAIAGRLAIVIGMLNPQGGGIFREIVELIEMYSGYEIMVLVTNMTCEAIPEQAHQLLAQHLGVCIKAAPAACTDKLTWLSRTMAEHAPAKAYYYASHNDPYAQAIMQDGVCKNVCLFSFDHGYVCGISNPNLDCIVAKRPLDYTMLRKHLGEKVIYIPTWSGGIKDCEGLNYRPFCEHTRLITASGAARFYKLSDKPPISYLDNVLELLARTRGVHYHFGPIPLEKLECIRIWLEEHNLPPESFVHVEWSDNMLRDMLVNHVDIFLEPFPVVSYKMTLEVLAGGIPIFAQDSICRMSWLDFIYSGNLLWKTREDFLDTLTSLTPELLIEHSKRSLTYYLENHAKETVKPYLMEEKPFPLPRYIEAVDGSLQEIRPYEHMFQQGAIDLLGQLQADMHFAVSAVRRETAELQLQTIQHTPSYRIGYAITWLPRFARRAFAIMRKSGITELRHQLRNHGLLYEKHFDPQAMLGAVHASKTWRIGHGLTYPYRKLLRKPQLQPTKTQNIQEAFHSSQESKSPSEHRWREAFFKITLQRDWQNLAIPLSKDCALTWLEMYALYRSMQYGQPRHILEFGITSGTGLIDTYLCKHKNADCLLIDPDEEKLKQYEATRHFTTVAFSDKEAVRAAMKQRCFDLIVIHGLACDGQALALLEENFLSLPQGVARTYAILLSEADSEALENSAREFSERLAANGLLLSQRTYASDHSLHVWCSENYCALISL